MNKTFIIAGPQGSGKTTLITGLIQLAATKGEKAGAFKPFDQNQLYLNANELDSDSEIFCKIMSGEPSTSFVTPYVANEDYPIELAFRRDGIRVDWNFVKERKNLLAEHYTPLFIEAPAGIAEPINEDKTLIQWMTEVGCKVIYGLSPKKEDFALQMAEISLLQQYKIDFHLWINNTMPPRDGDYLFYLWEKTEKYAGRHIEGMLPFSLEIEAEDLPQSLITHLPGLIKAIDA